MKMARKWRPKAFGPPFSLILHCFMPCPSMLDWEIGHLSLNLAILGCILRWRLQDFRPSWVRGSWDFWPKFFFQMAPNFFHNFVISWIKIFFDKNSSYASFFTKIFMNDNIACIVVHERQYRTPVLSFMNDNTGLYKVAYNDNISPLKDKYTAFWPIRGKTIVLYVAGTARGVRGLIYLW